MKKQSQRQPVILPTLAPLRVAMLSTYIPKRCGIATFTKDLANALNVLNPERLVEIVAVDAQEDQPLDYPWEVKRVVKKQALADYQAAAEYFNQSIVDLVVIQHEYGIFGGKDGEYILEFTKKLKKPFIVILHTILKTPSENQKRILQELSKKAKALVTMLPVAADILEEVFSVPQEKTLIIPHGTPDFSFAKDTAKIKASFGLTDKIVASSINLIDPNKGFEYVLEAIPQVVKKYPQFVYLLIGETHPEVKKRYGESYRQKLEQMVQDLKIEDHVKFVNKYVTLEDLIKYLKASDFYITPYNNTEQISSGALSYAIAAGKLCISTPYRYALENLSGGKGYIVNIADSKDISKALLHALDNPQQSATMKQKCYEQGRRMTWNRVAYLYLELFQKLVKNKQKQAIVAKPNFDYLKKLTSSLGLFEHASSEGIKYEEGLSSDDNSRALVAALEQRRYRFGEKYLNFLIKSERNGKIYCDADQTGQWTGEPGLGDYFGRTFWAVCFCLQKGDDKLKKRAKKLFDKLFDSLDQVNALRSRAYCLIGLCLLEEQNNILGLAITKAREKLARDLMDSFKKNSDQDWVWFEKTITYDNARIPQALISYSQLTGDQQAKEIGLASLNFLIDATFDLKDSCFKFIGSDGWFKKGGQKSTNNEQPIEAGSMTEGIVQAYLLTEKNYYLEMAQKAFSWYLGNNTLRTSLYLADKGAVYDGIGEMFGPGRINTNQGAEATLSYHLGYFALLKAIKHSPSKQVNTIIYTPHQLKAALRKKQILYGLPK